MRGLASFAPFAFALLLSAPAAVAAEQRITSPGGGLAAIVSDDGGLHYRVEVNGQAVVVESPLGLGFKDGTKLGPSATLTNISVTTQRAVAPGSVLQLSLARGGGFAGIISQTQTPR